MTAGTLLSPTDWYVTRNAENGSAIPQDVLDRREEIRNYSNVKEIALTATTSTDELAAYVTSQSFSEWAPPVVVEEPVELPVEQPVSGSNDGIIGSAGEDTLIFTGGSTSSSIGSTDSVIFE